MTEKEYRSSIEAILFAAGDPVDIKRLAETLKLPESAVETQLNILMDEYAEMDRGITIIRLNNSFQMVSVKEYAPQVRKAMDLRRNIPLSQAAMEVLAVIAYNQPVTKSFVEQVRGVDCSGVIGSLTTKGLIEERDVWSCPADRCCTAPPTISCAVFPSVRWTSCLPSRRMRTRAAEANSSVSLRTTAKKKPNRPNHPTTVP